MSHDSPNRRKVLQSLAGGVSALTISTRKVKAAKSDSVTKYNSSDRGPISEKKRRELRNQYFDMDVEKQRDVFNRNAAKIFETLSSPVSENEVLSERVDDRYVESDWRIIEEPSIEAFPFNHGFASMGFGTWGGTPSASLRTHKWMKDFKLDLTVQPEINRAYMIVTQRFDPKDGDKHFVIEEQDNTIVSTTSSCYTSGVCKYEEVHIEACANDPGCWTTEVYCCPDSDDCYWGEVSTNECGGTGCCSGCRYHCFGGDCYSS
jgi:hypothetical protein